jgi:hypothetical protein
VVESKTTKGQTIIYKILHRKQTTEQHEQHYTTGGKHMCSGRVTVDEASSGHSLSANIYGPSISVKK